MTKTLPSSKENTSDLVLWTALICAAVTLVLFFSWILKGQSALFSPDNQDNLPAQPLSEVHPGTNGAPESSNIAGSEIARAEGEGGTIVNDPSLVTDRKQADLKSSANLESVIGSATQQELNGDALPEGVAVKSGQSTHEQTDQSGQSPVQTSAEQINHQPRHAEYTTADNGTQGQVAAEQNRNAQVSTSLTETNDTLVDELVEKSESAETSLQSDSTEASSTQDNQEVAGGSLERVDVDPDQESPEPSETQSALADLGDLRQLLAEAAAISTEEDEQVRIERERREALSALGQLSSTLRFASGSKVVSEAMAPALDQIEGILARYPETRISVIVASNESGDKKLDLLLSQERGRALIARLVNDGTDFTRLSLKALSDEQLPANSHRIEILAQSES